MKYPNPKDFENFEDFTAAFFEAMNKNLEIPDGAITAALAKKLQRLGRDITITLNGVFTDLANESADDQQGAAGVLFASFFIAAYNHPEWLQAFVQEMGVVGEISAQASALVLLEAWPIDRMEVPANV